MLKTVRERGTVFKLDQPVNEIFSRMREVSKKYLEILDPNSFYLTVSRLFQPNLGVDFKLPTYHLVYLSHQHYEFADCGLFGQVTVGRLAHRNFVIFDRSIAQTVSRCTCVCFNQVVDRIFEVSTCN